MEGTAIAEQCISKLYRIKIKAIQSAVGKD